MLVVVLVGALGLVVGPLLARAASGLANPTADAYPSHAGGSLTAAARRHVLQALRESAGTMEGHRRGTQVLLSALTGLLFAGTAARFGTDPALPAYLYLATLGLLLSLVDLRSHRLPNVLTLPSYPIAAGLLTLAALFDSDSGSLPRAVAGGAASYLLHLAPRLAHPQGLGFGDVKSAGLLGIYTGWLGWTTWTVSLLSAWLYAGAFAIGLLALGKAHRHSRIALAPYLVGGSITAVLLT